MDFLKKLRLFLNNECVWKTNPGSSQFTRIYSATTAASPMFALPNAGKKGRRFFAYNVTAIVLKPKTSPFYVTVYINGELIAAVMPTAFCVKSIPGKWGLYLIYFGKLSGVGDAVKIPKDVSQLPPFEMIPTYGEIIDCTTNCTGQSIKEILGPGAIPVGKCTWTNGTQTVEFFLNDSMAMMCPKISGVPSLGRLVNLLTRCTDQSCVACFGNAIHAAVYTGHTDTHSSGSSSVCPCVLSCAAATGSHTVITGNKHLLALLFEGTKHMTIVALRFRNPTDPRSISDIMCGLNEEGDEIECSGSQWTTLVHSVLSTRLQIYSCQILKRLCLHSY